jgi:hypothetical protein
MRLKKGRWHVKLPESGHNIVMVSVRCGSQWFVVQPYRWCDEELKKRGLPKYYELSGTGDLILLPTPDKNYYMRIKMQLKRYVTL